ncbi:MAG: hypothetical protein AABY27_07195 [Pseudomonadota bacterium]
MTEINYVFSVCISALAFYAVFFLYNLLKLKREEKLLKSNETEI